MAGKSDTPGMNATLNVLDSFSGKHIFITGVTGFVGKVLLAMLAARVPSVRRVSVLVRTNRDYDNARRRFDAVVAKSEPFDAVAKTLGKGALKAWCDDVVNVVKGDISLERLGLSESAYRELTENDPVDLILHCAGNVNFNPPLDQALMVNSMGVAHKVEFARDAGCPLVHMSTCFVVGQRSGPIDEDRPIVGYAPNDREFDPERELSDAVFLAEEVRRRADAQALECRFLDEAKKRLTDKGLDYEDPQRLQAAFEARKTRWVNDELTREGMERAQQWGWTNTYTYTKSLGEQLTLKRAAEMGVRVSIVRPAIVESALEFPFSGWNEGVNTCAPFVYIMYKGHRFIPCNPDNILDLVPVDYVCRGTILAGADLLSGGPSQVFHLASGDSNPLRMRRAVEMTNLAWRRHYDRHEKNLFKRHLMRNLDSIPVDRETYNRISAPQVNRITKSTRAALKMIPKAWLGPARPLVKQLDGALAGLEKASGVCNSILDLFAPFVEENNPCFSTRNIRTLSTRLPEGNAGEFSFSLCELDWRHYWIDVHMQGLQKWVFGELDDRMRPVRKVAKARDLVEVFRTACRAHKERKAVSFYTSEQGVESTYTFGEVYDAACRVAGYLKTQGIRRGDAIVLMSKNEPAWPMIYFGILLADAVAVPVDFEMPDAELGRIIAKCQSKLLIHHEDRLPEQSCPMASVGDVFDAEPVLEIECRDRSEDVASLLFTSGTTGDPKGVMLTHGNFTALLASLHGTFRVDHKDRFLSVLPLFHTFEFSCGLLMPLSVGAHVLYLDELEGGLLREALSDFRPTGLIGVPALWDVLHRRIETEVRDRGEAAHLAFTAMLRLSRFLKKQYGVNLGPMSFSEVHRMLGGQIRHLISGGAALSEPVLNAFEGLGFELLEGYGLTEAAPVLSVRRPGDRKGSGSVGTGLPGVKLHVLDPDADGVGEVVARGANVMAGYLNDPEATRNTVKEGWLHTGDLGRLDKDGRLTLVGRRKELIVTSSGKNVYPDELESVYSDHDLIEEICIVGIPDPQGDQRVGALIVPVENPPADYQAQIKAHFTKTGMGLADHQRIRTLRFWTEKLPRTATRKIKRADVREQLIRLVSVGKSSRREGMSVPAGREPAWLYGAIAALAGLESVDVTPETHLTQDLGLSSLQYVELRLLIEEKVKTSLDPERLMSCSTVGELAHLVDSKDFGRATVVVDAQEPRPMPDALADVGRQLLGSAQKKLYDQAFKVQVKGTENIPRNSQVLVISNHSSHLDMGLVKYALGDYAPNLSALAASDYFFDKQYKRDFFEPFTNLIPVERSGSLEKSLRHAETALNRGRIVLVFPEGTRSPDGQLQEFKHGVGYLQQKSQLSVLPLFLRGTYRALPKGAAVPTQRKLTAVIGPVIDHAFIEEQTKGMNRIETYARIAEILHLAVRALRDGDVYPWLAGETAARGQSELEAIFEELPRRFVPEALSKPTTWYFSLGDKSDGKWTLRAKEDHVEATPGRPSDGNADCVLKTDVKTFTKIVREGYVPSFTEFTDGRVKTNDPNLLMQFKSTFGL
ncbi:MAG: AMP-binding protein [Myxococcota bacterium]|nr:AMP-binding protein [Myxococcota bacterium]